MHKIYVLMGKSCSGKNTVAEKLLKSKKLGFHRVVTYTTRPMRANEQEGREYHFVTRQDYSALTEAGKVIDFHEYKTIDGLWFYFTVDDGQINLDEHDSLIIGTPSIVKNLQNYFGKDSVVPILLEVSDEDLIHRAVSREEDQKVPNYAEMCRRFLADREDFSDEVMNSLGKIYRVDNGSLGRNLWLCADKIEKIIKENSTGATKVVTFDIDIHAVRRGKIEVPADANVDACYIKDHLEDADVDESDLDPEGLDHIDIKILKD